jgi:CRISPR/Cas system CSM-associated protein Csm3 (group 7 of RAMP superfamily)
MLKRLRSECEIRLEIATDGPLLIKSGQTFASGVDMTAVRTMRNGRWEVYIPGS